MKKIVIKQDEENPIPQEVMASAIIKISESVQEMLSTRLQTETIVSLIYDRTKIAKTTIRIVINELRDMEKVWLKPKK